MAKKSELVRDLTESFEELEKLLTERIADLHEVKGAMQARHAYIFYRQKLYEIRNLTSKLIDAS